MTEGNLGNRSTTINSGHDKSETIAVLICFPKIKDRFTGERIIPSFFAVVVKIVSVSAVIFRLDMGENFVRPFNEV